MTSEMQSCIQALVSYVFEGFNTWSVDSSTWIFVQFCDQCSQRTWKPWNFVIFFSMPGKCLEFAQKVVKTWNFNSKNLEKIEICKFYVSSFAFQDVIYKNNSDLLISQHKH